MVITSRAPVRVDFAGAWTDVAEFYEPFTGATLNAAIRFYVSGQLDAYEGEETAPAGRIVSGPSGKYSVPSRAGLTVQYESMIPAGSGLGTSAALNVVWLSLARRTSVETIEEKMQIADLAYKVEGLLGIVGGKQDQYASAVGGINLFEFGPEDVRCHSVQMSEGTLNQLQDQLVLCYTGKSRLSSGIHRHVWGNFRAGQEETVRALFTLRDTAYEAKQHLEAGNLQEFGELLTIQFECAKHLDSSTTNQQIDELFEMAAPMIIGGKPCGAGGGGCLLFLARSPESAKELEEELKQHRLTVLNLQFDFQGLCLQTEK